MPDDRGVETDFVRVKLEVMIYAVFTELPVNNGNTPICSAADEG